MGAAYSSLGRTKFLYATSFVLLGAKTKLLRRKPSVLVALKEISEMCWPQSIVSEIVITGVARGFIMLNTTPQKWRLRNIWHSFFTFQIVNNKCADQTAQMGRLFCVFAVRKQQI